jgi:hypothetical protein
MEGFDTWKSILLSYRVEKRDRILPKTKTPKLGTNLGKHKLTHPRIPCAG